MDLRKGLEPGSHRDKLVEEMRQNGEKMVKQASQFWGSLLTMVDPEHHQELVPTDSHLIFEPQSLGPGMSLSTDKRKVFHSQWMKFCSSNLFLIKGTVLVPDFKGWVISISKDCDWTIGVCDDNYATSMKDGYVYGLRCQGNQLFSLTTESSWVIKETPPVMGFGKAKIKTPRQHYKVSHQVINTPSGNVEPQMTRPQIVEVVWSFPDSLSFFSRIGQHQRINLLTVTISSRSSDLKPFVCLQGLEKEATNEFSFSSSATTSPFGGFPQQYQNQPKCSCGMFNV
ncbi:unnamed protein product [Oreochromis niloticus]|nr:unnamed protein product [Mustela putorius furo]